ncbi:MAG: (d)CMP kinase [Candidatus Nanoarchaeia archaeon]
MKIVISGTPASGKSTVAKEVAKRLGFKHYSMGDLQREIANEKGITIDELSELESKDKSLDTYIDAKQKQIGKEEDNFVLDSRLGAHFIPDAIKIFIDADPNIRVERRLKQKRNEETFNEKEKAFETMKQREHTDRNRFIEYYGFDFLDMFNYDKIIDSTTSTIEDCAREITDFVNDFR